MSKITNAFVAAYTRSAWDNYAYSNHMHFTGNRYFMKEIELRYINHYTQLKGVKYKTLYVLYDPIEAEIKEPLLDIVTYAEDKNFHIIDLSDTIEEMKQEKVDIEYTEAKIVKEWISEYFNLTDVSDDFITSICRCRNLYARQQISFKEASSLIDKLIAKELASKKYSYNIYKRNPKYNE